MIDLIKLTLSNFQGNLDRCEIHRDYKTSIACRLYNPDKNDSAFLYLTFTRKTKKLQIKGSLRKWYFGSTSYSDLEFCYINIVILEISKLIGILPEKLHESMITQCELGLNIKTRIPCEKIIPKISHYGHLKRYEYDGETVGFKGRNKELKIYDKTNEIIENNSNTISSLEKMMFKVLKEKGEYFLRIEFTLKDKQSFIQDDLGNLSTLGGLIQNYSKLYVFLTKEISEIRMSNVIIYDDLMTPIEFLIARDINANGFNDTSKSFPNTFKSKTDRGLISARSKAFLKVCQVLKKYESKKEYNKNSLLFDIARKLIIISRTDKTVKLPVLLRNLWGGLH